ncbi:sensor histidine kinase [Deferrisoma palaeochoriense]
MTAGRLFLKIFVAFWLAMILIGAGIAAITLTRPPPPMPHEVLLPRVPEVLAVWDRAGPDAGAERLERLGRRVGATLYLFRPDGAWIGSDEPPAEVRTLAEAQFRGHRMRGMARRLGLRAWMAAGPTVLVARFSPPHPLWRWARLDTLGQRLALMFVVAGLVCFGLARYLAAPVRAIREATRELAAGNLGVRVGPRLGRRRDEIADLGRDFDRMAERIQALLESHRTLLRDVSHELRSPLARLRVALELARADAGPAALPSLERAEREIGRLDHLIGEVLTLSRLQAAAPKLRRERIDLAGLAEAIAADARFEAPDREVRVSVEGSVEVEGDPELLRRALENVVRNAVRHTPAGGEVRVEVGAGGGEARVAVLDAGPGVPEVDLERIFEPFRRVERARERGAGGAGLGLAIARSAVEAHGGRTSAENRPEGGLRVEARFPVRA